MYIRIKNIKTQETISTVVGKGENINRSLFTVRSEDQLAST